MKLVGTSVQLRHPEEADVSIILRWENDVANWLVSDTIKPYSEEEITSFVKAGQDFFRDGQMRWMMETKQGQVVGCIDIFDFDQKNRRAGVGVLIDEEFRGRGYGLEAIKLAIDSSFTDFELHSLYAEVLEGNMASRTLFERSGFELIGVKKDWHWDGARYHNQMFYQMIGKR